MRINLRLPTPVVLIISVSLLAGAEPQDQKALQGKWQATEATSNGEPPPAGMLEKISLVFTNNMISVMGAPSVRFIIDTNATPARIDILNSARQVGIYELKGDTLKLCVGVSGDRPNAFVTKKYTDQTYMLLKRVKE